MTVLTTPIRYILDCIMLNVVYFLAHLSMSHVSFCNQVMSSVLAYLTMDKGHMSINFAFRLSLLA
jgi:hypothetical protein